MHVKEYNNKTRSFTCCLWIALTKKRCDALSYKIYNTKFHLYRDGKLKKLQVKDVARTRSTPGTRRRSSSSSSSSEDLGRRRAKSSHAKGAKEGRSASEHRRRSSVARDGSGDEHHDRHRHSRGAAQDSSSDEGHAAR